MTVSLRDFGAVLQFQIEISNRASSPQKGDALCSKAAAQSRQRRQALRSSKA